AIGGGVNVISRNGRTEKSDLLEPRLYYRYVSANASGVARAEVKGNTIGLNYIVGGSLKDFNDLNGGRQVGLQPKTEYKDDSDDLRAQYLLSNNSTLTIAHQNVRQDNAWRTHRTIYGISWQNTTVGTDRELFYDQNRQLTYAQYEHNGLFSFSEKLKASVSYQVQSEDEVRVRSNGNINRQGFDVRTTGFWLQSESPVLKTGKMVAGIEYYNDTVDSYRRDYNSSGSLTNVDPLRYRPERSAGNTQYFT
ncbi:MAG: hypothetical protein HY762_01500, partial [Planctomycetes bacterium]|nr:hypothetical protein [Planctomycetota bacterium]